MTKSMENKWGKVTSKIWHKTKSGRDSNKNSKVFEMLNHESILMQKRYLNKEHTVGQALNRDSKGMSSQCKLMQL